MAYHTASFTGLDAYWGILKTHLAAAGWTLLKEEVSDADPNKHYMYWNSKGESGSDEINIGFRKSVNVPQNFYQIWINAYWTFDKDKLPADQQLQHGLVRTVLPHLQATYHIVVNKDRIAWVIEQGGYRYFAHLGFMKSLSPRSNYTYPYMVIGNTNDSNTTNGRWGGSNTRSFPVRDNGRMGYWMLDNETTWRQVSSISPYDHLWVQDGKQGLLMWQRQRGCVDDDIATGEASTWVIPSLVKYNRRWRGQLEGVFFPMGGAGYAPGDTASFGTGVNKRDFLIFNDRTQAVNQMYWAALEKK